MSNSDMYVCVYINVKAFFCINLIVEGVSNIVYIFSRRPIVFKKLIMFLRAIFKNSSFMLFALKKLFPGGVEFCAFYQNVLDWVLISTWTFWGRFFFKNEGVSQSSVSNTLSSKGSFFSSGIIRIQLPFFFFFLIGCIWKSLLWEFLH